MLKIYFVVLIAITNFCCIQPFTIHGPNNYHRTPGNIVQGDIGIPDVTKNANIVSNYWKKWPNGVIPYYINDNIPVQFRYLFDDSMKLIETQTEKCIRFVPYKRGTDPEPSNWLHILDNGSCWSWIGQGSGEQWLSLTWGCFYQSTIVHELLHTIGFWHEQSRPDRDDYVTINWKNILPANYGEFEKRGDTIDTMGMPYDLHSIMHYRYNTFAINQNKATITPNDPKVNMSELGTRDDLSAIDILKIWKYYNCKP